MRNIIIGEIIELSIILKILKHVYHGGISIFKNEIYLVIIKIINCKCNADGDGYYTW